MMKVKKFPLAVGKKTDMFLQINNLLPELYRKSNPVVL